VRNQRDVWVESAGTAGFRGLPASQGSADHARSIGIDLSAHRSSPLTAEKIAEADLILCMEEHHHAAVLSSDPAAAPRTFLLTHFLEPPRQDTEIHDPHGSDRADFQATGEQVMEACRALIRNLVI